MGVDGGIFLVNGGGWTFFMDGWGWVEVYFGWMGACGIFYGWVWVIGGIFWVDECVWNVFRVVGRGWRYILGE